MKQHSAIYMMAALAALLSAYVPTADAQGAAAITQPAAYLKWKDAGIPGVATAVVNGDMSKGPSHFYLRYAAGFAAPSHHHSPDHYATTVTGNLVLIVDGKEYRLSPGSYFAFKDKAKHAARCESAQACVMFIDARGPWDVIVAGK